VTKLTTARSLSKRERLLTTICNLVALNLAWNSVELSCAVELAAVNKV